jgi:hypothetical protein
MQQREKSLEQKVNDIHREIIGSAEYKHKGLLDRVAELEEEKKARWKTMIKTGSIGGLIGGTLGLFSQKIGLVKLAGLLGHLF